MIDVMNAQFVGRLGDRVTVGMPARAMTPDEALVHAAWLVAISEHDATEKFADVLKAVKNT